MATLPALPPDKDPALIASSSTAAAALLGSAALTGLAARGATSGGGPADALPPMAGAGAPVAPSSRYADTGVATWTAPDGTVHRFIGRRLVPQPEALATAGWERVHPGDRIDTLAARALGDPLSFWRLCDAAGVTDPAELEQSGRLARVPLPEGFGAAEADDG